MTINEDLLGPLADRRGDCLLAVVLATDGSTPGKVGAKAIVNANGGIQGTVGGGRVEAEVQRQAAAVIAGGRPVLLDFQLNGHAVTGEEAVCGGTMRLLLDPSPADHVAALEAAAIAETSRQRGVLLTTVRSGAECEVDVEYLPEASIPSHRGFPDAAAMLAVLQREQPAWNQQQPAATADVTEVLIEPVVPTPILLIVGGGHVGQAVAAQAVLVGFEVTVMDDRPEFTTPDRFPPTVRMCCGEIEEQLDAFPFDRDTYVVIVTRGHRQDAEALAKCIHGTVAYVGMIGSRRKVAMMRSDFIQSGRVTAEEFDRVYAPIGLDLGARTVPEIAASIVAQLIAVRRRGDSPRISLR